MKEQHHFQQTMKMMFNVQSFDENVVFRVIYRPQSVIKNLDECGRDGY